MSESSESNKVVRTVKNKCGGPISSTPASHHTAHCQGGPHLAGG